MANYEAKARTNYFQVTDEEKFKEWMQEYNSYAQLLTKDGKFAFAYEDAGFAFSDKDEDNAFALLQKLLLENEAVIIKEVGYEKMNYLTAYCIIITQKEIDTISLSDIALAKTRELLGVHFTTEMEY